MGEPTTDSEIMVGDCNAVEYKYSLLPGEVIGIYRLTAVLLSGISGDHLDVTGIAKQEGRHLLYER